MNDQLLGIKDVANILDVHWQTVRRYIDKGSLSALKIGRNIRIRREDLEKFISSNKGVDKEVEVQLRYECLEYKEFQKRLIDKGAKVVFAGDIIDHWYIPKNVYNFKDNQKDFDEGKAYGLYIRELKSKYSEERKVQLKIKRLAEKHYHPVCLRSDVEVKSIESLQYLLELMDHKKIMDIKKKRTVFFLNDYKVVIDRFDDSTTSVEIELVGKNSTQERLIKDIEQFVKEIGDEILEKYERSKTYLILKQLYEK